MNSPESAVQSEPAPNVIFLFSSRRRHTRLQGDWSSDVCSSDLDVVEERVPLFAEPGREAELREAVVRFSREVAFAAARVYARAAESRGLWDARLQALLVDALLRGEAPDVIASRASALGWPDATPVSVAVGRSPGGEAAAIVYNIYRAGRRISVEVIGGVHGDRLVAVLGGANDPLSAVEKMLSGF